MIRGARGSIPRIGVFFSLYSSHFCSDILLILNPENFVKVSRCVLALTRSELSELVATAGQKPATVF
jgi:hypothetical protein